MCLIASPVKTYLKYQKNIIKQLLLMHEHMLGQGGSAQNFFKNQFKCCICHLHKRGKLYNIFLQAPCTANVRRNARFTEDNVLVMVLQSQCIIMSTGF